MSDEPGPHYPQPAAAAGRIEPCPRRVRAILGGRTVIDTTRALYLWEWPFYPQFQIPAGDVDADALVAETREHRVAHGRVRTVGLRVGEADRPAVGRRYLESPQAELVDTIRFDWDGLDAWYEEDEQVFVHPRNPYVRVDALRSTRPVRVALDGVVLAESAAPVMVFETGLPTRCYLDPSAVDFTHLEPSPTQTACPYKGRTSAYWSVRIGETLHEDLAWRYDFPTRQLLPVAGLVCFYDEKVDVILDGAAQPRPQTHFS